MLTAINSQVAACRGVIARARTGPGGDTLAGDVAAWRVMEMATSSEGSRLLKSAREQAWWVAFGL